MDKVKENAAGYDERQKRIDQALVPTKVLEMVKHPMVLSALAGKDLQGKMFFLVYNSTSALERVVNGGNPAGEMAGMDLVPLEDAEKQNPQSRTIQICKATPGTFCVCIATFLPLYMFGMPGNILTHTITCLQISALSDKK